MISVIVPTMWRALDYTRICLRMLDDHPLVDEILLIDNEPASKNEELLNSLTKLTYHTFPEGNIFVNPAWNFGAKNAKHDKLFILNDDCIVNFARLEQIYEAITPEKGMMGFSALSYCTYAYEGFETLCNSGFGTDITIDPIDPRVYPKSSGMPHPFYGSAYFIHRDNYFDIPEEFKIHYGDLYIYLSNLKKKLHNYVIEDGLVMTQYSSTVSTASVDILNHEAEIMRQVFEEHGLKDITYKLPTEI